MGWESSVVVGLDLGPLLQGEMSIAKVKSAFLGRVFIYLSFKSFTNTLSFPLWVEEDLSWSGFQTLPGRPPSQTCAVTWSRTESRALGRVWV